MKVKGLSIITGFVAALLFTITLRFFKLFNFINGIQSDIQIS